MAQFTTSSLITLVRILIDDNLQTDGKTYHEYDSDTSFQLAHSLVSSSTIKVYKNGTLLTLTTDYTYNSTTNKITIIASLTKGDDIIITYSYYNTYSDTEIQNFIKASLLELSKRRYSKLLYMNSSNNIVTSNGTNPTDAEGNLIASITAVLIDPQNQKIRTPDYSLDAPEKLSRKDQIDDMFSKFTKCYGVVKFLQEEIDS
jgi:hypothetical protein